MQKKVVVIGSGFSSLSAASYLAKCNFDVTVIEKNSTPGGRARKLEVNGYNFDMGPSWYWMPDVFEQFYNHFNKKTSDFYTLKRLSPSYSVYFGKEDELLIPADLTELCTLFESLESGADEMLRKFLNEAEYKYDVGINKLVHKPGQSISEFLDWDLAKGVMKLDVFQSMTKHIQKHFKNEKIIRILEFPVLFLGAMPEKTPALYSLMNFADMVLGTWYPMGGMYKIVEAMMSIAQEQGVKFEFNQNVQAIDVVKGKAVSVTTSTAKFAADIVVAGSDYHHTEQTLLAKEYRVYSEEYWDSRVLAPSSLLFYLGIKKPLLKLQHHTLFFDEPFGPHAQAIYVTPQWPEKALFYVCRTTASDASVAPEGCENIFLLMPVAPGLKDDEAIREKYYDMMMKRLEAYCGEEISSFVEYKKSYAHSNFIEDYNSYKGNAYGLANTLMQTANLKPSLKSKKVKNLYYTGQLTVPGPGVPPAIISGKVVTEQILKNFKK